MSAMASAAVRRGAESDGENRSRRTWARVAGLLYVATNVTAILGFVLKGGLIVRGDAAATAANLAQSGTLYRASLALELVTVAGVIPLIVGLFVALRPVAPNLALLAAFWRLMENALLAVLTLSSFLALALIPRGAALGDAQAMPALVGALLYVHTYGFQLGFFFLGLGSTLFSWLWWRSRLIPRWLAGLGLFASALMAVVALGIVVDPRVYATVTMAYMAPMGIYEIGLGLWLLIRGIDPQRTDAI
jgi:hypothetical protein